MVPEVYPKNFNQKCQNLKKYIIKGNKLGCTSISELYSIHFTHINIDVHLYLYLLKDICKYIPS